MTARILLDLPEGEYHAHPALSQSGCKDMLVSPSYYQWRRTHPTESDALDEGKAAHRLVLGVGPELVRMDFTDWRTKAAQEARAEVRAADGVPLLPEQYDRIRAMADRLSEHTLAMQLLSEGQPEVSLFGELDGVPVRGRVDWLGQRIITDYKTTRDMSPAAFGRAAYTYGYYIQAAFYLDLLEAVGEPREAFAFIVQSKAGPYDVFVTELEPEAVALGRARYLRAVEMFRDCTASGHWPAAVPDDAFVTTRLPAWAYRDHDLEETYT